MHVAQRPEALRKLESQLAVLDDFSLAAAHDLISLSGSLVLALAVTHKKIAAQDAWLLSRVDEHWQIEQWGKDDEAEEAEAIKRTAFLDAARFYEISQV